MKDHSIVLNVMTGEAGEVLDRNRTHVIRKDADGKILAVFNNPGQEDNLVKMTFTALEPYSQFEILLDDKNCGTKKANTAGILECRLELPARSRLTVREIEK